MHSSLNRVERLARRAGLATLLVTLATLLWGIWRGTQRATGQESGHEPESLRTRAVYALAIAGYFSLCYRLWRAMPFPGQRAVRLLTLLSGSLLYFPGLALILWGRLTLGRMYGVSSTLGARLYAGHRLITHSPYAVVRHPMYLGILLAGLGGLLLYRTWTFAFVLLHFPVLVVRALREERALAAQFGAEWEGYRRRVPGWLPSMLKSS